MLIELPCGLSIDDVVYDHVIVEELKGKQQNYLSNMELTTDSFGHIPKLLADLVKDFQTKQGKPADISSDDAIWKIPTEDIQVILIKIREITFGASYALPAMCPHCGKQDFYKIDLDKLEIKKLKNKKVREKKITLPKSGKEMVVKLFYLQDLFDLYSVLRNKGDALFTSSMQYSIKSIDGKSPVTASDLDEIPLSDLHAAEKVAMALRGKVDLMITSECSGCKQDFEAPLPVMDPLFFVPSETPSTASPRTIPTIGQIT